MRGKGGEDTINKRLFAVVFSGVIILLISSASIGVTLRSYDPWLDNDDNGRIDMTDIIAVIEAFGASGTAINKTALLLELEARMGQVEERQSNVRTVRFVEPAECVNDQVDSYVTGATFQILSNNSENAILGLYCYFQYRADAGFYRIVVNGIPSYGGAVSFQSPSVEYRWSYIYSWIGPYASGFNGILIEPNQNSYTLEFQFKSQSGEAVYVKNINIVAEVIDGLPPS